MHCLWSSYTKYAVWNAKICIIFHSYELCICGVHIHRSLYPRSPGICPLQIVWDNCIFFFCCKALFDQKLNPCLLHWKVKYSPLDHQRSPQILILTWPITQIAFYVDSKQSSQNQNGVVGVMREKSLFLEETHLKLMELTAIVFISSSSPYHFKTFLACHLDITFTQVLRRKLRCLIIMQIRQNRHIFDRRIN